LFQNRSNGKLTRAGIAYILKKHVDEARSLHPELIPKMISPHCFRHSKAMHLLQSGVNLVYMQNGTLSIEFVNDSKRYQIHTYRLFLRYDYEPMTEKQGDEDNQNTHFVDMNGRTMPCWLWILR
jgi:site-specific recombinase XerD